MARPINTLLGIVLGALAFFCAQYMVRRKRLTIAVPDMPVVTIEDIGDVFEALSSQGKEGSFAVFLCGENAEPPAARDALNVQFSIAEGALGIDWVLLAPVNRETQARFSDFFEAKGYEVSEKSQNDVDFLRVEGDHLAELLQEFLASQFGVTPTQPLDLIADGFDWSDSDDE